MHEVIEIAEGSEPLSLLSTMVNMLKLQRTSHRCTNAVSLLSEHKVFTSNPVSSLLELVSQRCLFPRVCGLGFWT